MNTKQKIEEILGEIIINHPSQIPDLPEQTKYWAIDYLGKEYIKEITENILTTLKEDMLEKIEKLMEWEKIESTAYSSTQVLLNNPHNQALNQIKEIIKGI